jgi:phage protein D
MAKKSSSKKSSGKKSSAKKSSGKKKSSTTAKAKSSKNKKSDNSQAIEKVTGLWNGTRTVEVGANMKGSGLVTPYLVDEASYTTHYHGESDSFDFTLDNTKGNFLKGETPYKGQAVSGFIDRNGWKRQNDETVLTGDMFVDSYTASGPSADTVSVTALSAPSYHEVSSLERTHTYKNTTLKTIAKKVAKRAGFKLEYHGPSVKIVKKKQDGATDLDFLTSCCEDYGFRVRIHDKTFYVYDAVRFAKKKPAMTIPKYWIGDGYSYETDIQGAYGYAVNTYQVKRRNSEKEAKVTSNLPQYKAKTTHYVQGTLKRTKHMHVKPSASSGDMGTFKKGTKFVVDKKYPNGWAKVHYRKTYYETVWVDNGDYTGGQRVTGKRSKIISVAESVLGKRESYFGWSGAWCAYFVQWVLKKSGNSHSLQQIAKHSSQRLGNTGPFHDWCKSHPAKPGNIMPGDIVVFNWSKNKNGGADHVGFVLKVSKDKRRVVKTIEGNTSKKGHKGTMVAIHSGDHTPYIIGIGHLPLQGSLTYATARKSKTHKNQHKEQRPVKKKVYGYIYVGKKNQNMSMKKKTHISYKKHSRKLTVDSAGTSKYEAKVIARNKLNMANEAIEKLTIDMPGGYSRALAGKVVNLGSDWGGLKGKWFVEECVMSYGASQAYTQEITTHRITSSNTKVTPINVGASCRFKGGYVHSSRNGGKAHKVKKVTKVIVKKRKDGSKYPYEVETIPQYSKWKKKKMEVMDYTYADRTEGVNGVRLTEGCCACDHLPLYSKIRIGGKLYKVVDRTRGKTDGIMIWHSDPNYKSKGKRKVTVEYKERTKKPRVIGWCSSAELEVIPQSDKGTTVTGRTKKSFTVSTKYYPSQGGKNAVIVWNTLAKCGWSPEATAAIMGCVQHESPGFRPNLVDPIDGGWGLCQWTFSRNPRAKNWCRKHGGYKVSVETQYLNHEMKHDYPSCYKYHKSRNLTNAFNHLIAFEDPRFYKNRNKHATHPGAYDWHDNFYARLRSANYFYKWFATRRKN